jgi:FkbM family methyltransferase
MLNLIRSRGGEATWRCRNELRRRGLEVLRIPPAPSVRSAFGAKPSLLGLHLARLFEMLNVNLVIDVGACVGDYGFWIRRNGFAGQIVSFEPVADSYRVLQQSSSGDPLWRAYPHALGTAKGQAVINVAREYGFSSFLHRNEFSDTLFGEDSQIEKVEIVEVHRLDEIFGELVEGIGNPRAYLKMDTQGWDLEVLDGATGCLDSIVALQSEVSVHPIYENMTTFTGSIERFKELGFSLSGLFPVSFTGNLEAIEFDCIAVRSALQC